MDAREALQRDPRVDNDDIDDIIGIAQELQDAARDRAERPTVGEVEQVAADLDIDPALVREAIAVLHSRRAEETERLAQEAAEQAQQRRQLTRYALFGVGGLIGVGGLALAIFLAVAASAAASISEARGRVRHAEAQLDVALDRQAALAPQLVSLAGADPAVLEPLTREVREASTAEARLTASDRLSDAIARELSSVKPDAASERRMLEVQHELTGTQNRISTERRRYVTAVADLEQAGSGIGGSAARALGW